MLRIYFIILLLEKFVRGSAAVMSDQEMFSVDRWKKGKIIY